MGIAEVNNNLYEAKRFVCLKMLTSWGEMFNHVTVFESSEDTVSDSGVICGSREQEPAVEPFFV